MDFNLVNRFSRSSEQIDQTAQLGIDATILHLTTLYLDRDLCSEHPELGHNLTRN
jgi:hypothetical protein